MEYGSATVNYWHLADWVVAWDPWRLVAAFMKVNVLSLTQFQGWACVLNYRLEGRNAMYGHVSVCGTACECHSPQVITTVKGVLCQGCQIGFFEAKFHKSCFFKIWLASQNSFAFFVVFLYAKIICTKITYHPFSKSFSFKENVFRSVT